MGCMAVARLNEAPYRGFSMLGDIQQPTRYDPKLTLAR
jgi:hypothetical protein